MKKLFLVCQLSLLAFTSCMDVKAVSPDPECGDYMINQEGEECDTWDTGGHSCATLGYHDGVLGCTAQCTLDFSDCERFGSCGDGLVQAGAGEECDLADLHEKTCASLGYHGGELACTADCRFDVTSCEEFGSCGDGIAQETDEECDLDEFAPAFESCEALGFYGGTVACMANCRADLSNCRTHGACGDGLIQSAAGEECDTNSLGATSCYTLGFFAGPLACDECVFDTAGCINPVDVDSGTSHTCAVLDDGTAWCWGSGSEGQLGNNRSSDQEYLEYSPTPVQMPSGVHFASIAAGTNHTCALDTLGRAWCWGLDFGLLGTSNPQEGRVPVPSPVAMPQGRSFVKISLGLLHACALDSLGAVWCWGFNSAGQIGTGSRAAMIIPTPTALSATVSEVVVDVDCGLLHACAVTLSGALYCWGGDNSGQLGVDPATLPDPECDYLPVGGAPVLGPCTPTPTLVAAGVGQYARQVSAGGMLLSNADTGGVLQDTLVARSHTCVITTRDLVENSDDDFVFCFGANDAGQLGNDSQIPTHEPQYVRMPFNISSFQSVSVGFQHSCVTGRGVGWCWGLNLFGQLANGRADDVATTPTMVRKPVGVNLSMVTAGFAHNCSLSQGRIWCWGYGMEGQLGMGSSDIVPDLVEVRLPETSN